MIRKVVLGRLQAKENIGLLSGQLLFNFYFYYYFGSFPDSWGASVKMESDRRSRVGLRGDRNGLKVFGNRRKLDAASL
jgi:hypothetical protein